MKPNILFFVLPVLVGWGVWYLADEHRPLSQNSDTAKIEPNSKIVYEDLLKSNNSPVRDVTYAPLQIRLSGVLVAGSAEHRIAIVSMNGEKDTPMRVGESLTHSALVVSIGEDYLTYRNGEAIFRVDLDAAPGSGPADRRITSTDVPNASGASSRVTEKLAGFIPNSVAVPPAGHSEPENGNSIFKRDFDKRITAMQTQRSP